MVSVPNGGSRERVDRFLSRELGHSRAAIQRWIRQGLVTLGGARLEPSDLVSPGWELLVQSAPPLPSRAEPDPTVRFQVVFEDEHVIVVDKPAGVVVHPGKGNWTGTLINGLLARSSFGRPPADTRDPEGPLRPGIVHRIDKDTSGLLVVAKTEAARASLMGQLAGHSMVRSYLAICVGLPEPGRIETLHGRHPSDRLRFSSKVASGKRAITHLEIVERGASWSLVRCRLETGRTHQIRVHLSEQRRTPILADSLYGWGFRGALEATSRHLGRQALHATELGFVHPASGISIHFESRLPEDMENALTRLRAQAPG